MVVGPEPVYLKSDINLEVLYLPENVIFFLMVGVFHMRFNNKFRNRIFLLKEREYLIVSIPLNLPLYLLKLIVFMEENLFVVKIYKDSRNRTHTYDFEDHCSTIKLYPCIIK